MQFEDYSNVKCSVSVFVNSHLSCTFFHTGRCLLIFPIWDSKQHFNCSTNCTIIEKMALCLLVIIETDICVITITNGVGQFCFAPC